MTNASDESRKEQLLEEFRQNVFGRYQAQDLLDRKFEIACIKNMLRIMDELDSILPEGRAALARFLDSDELEVRGMAAAYLLNIMPEKALPILRDIDDHCYGDVAIDAMTALSKYKWGDWKI